jgi:hypothetical protein
MPEHSAPAEPPDPPEPNNAKAWGIGAAVALAILAISLLAMDKAGLFKPATDAPGAQRIAAALALVGAVLTAVVALVGTVVKFAIDDRTARQAAVDALRTHTLAAEEGRRNRIDVIIRAVDLLSENNKDATQSQIGGAVLALVNLGEYDMAVALVGQLWPAELTTRNLAERVLTEAFRNGSPETQEHAATVVYENAGKLSDPETYYWPFRNLGWRVDLSNDARLSLAVAAARWMIAELQRDKTTVSSAAVVLTKCLADPDDVVREFAGAVLRPFVRYYSARNFQFDLLLDVEKAILAAEREGRITNPPRAMIALKYAESVARLLEPLPASGPPEDALAGAPLPTTPDTRAAGGLS